MKDALNIKTKTDLNYSLGHATKQECEKAAQQFLGQGWCWPGDKRVRISADGLRQYRAPSVKDNRGNLVQANFEVKAKPGEVPPRLVKNQVKRNFLMVIYIFLTHNLRKDVGKDNEIDSSWLLCKE